jgi:hypothetical protein
VKIGKHTFLWIVVVLLSGVVAGEALVIWWFNAIYNPFVVTDSYNKNFDPKQFQFGHYSHVARNEHQFNPALLRMFPPETDKAYVEEILVKQAGAAVTNNNAGRFHSPGESAYSCIWGNWQISFVFDENDKTDTMMTSLVVPYGTDRKKEWREKLNPGGGNHE